MNMVIIKHCAGYLSRYLGRYLRGTSGIAAMEYAIIVGVGVVVVGVGVAVATFQDAIVGLIGDVTTDVTNTRSTITNANT